MQSVASMRMMIWSAGLALALGACVSAPGGTPTAGEALGAASRGLIDRYDEAALKAVVKELGYAVVESSITSSGKPFMTVEAPGEAQFRVMGESCEGAGKEQVCWGVQLSTQFGDTGGDLDVLMSTANRTLRPAKLFRVEAGAAYERYLIMDGGVSRENLKSNISVYVEILDALLKQL